MSGRPVARLAAHAVPGIPEVRRGDDLAALVVAACSAAGVELGSGDVLVVASKVVAKAEGRQVVAGDVAARQRAVESQTVRVLAERLHPDGRVTQVVHSRSGPVMAAAGVDASDVEDGTVLLLPLDADASARALRARVGELTGAHPAVLVSDTGGRPWRDGVADFALGAAGLEVLDDVRGRLDRSGRPLEVTVRAVADQVASLADLVKDKAAGTPVAVVRGLGRHVVPGDGAGAAGLVRVGPGDWFAHGHVEAVRAALGVAVGEVPPAPVVPGGPVHARLARAVAVAVAGHGSVTGGAAVTAGGGTARVAGEPYAAGAMVERLRAAAWTERLVLQVQRTSDGAVLTAREA